MPYTIGFENATTAEAFVGEVRIITELDDDLDISTFQLGGMRIGDIEVRVPLGRSFFQAEFNFVETRGFLLRIAVGVDATSNIATWLLQAIDPLTGELVRTESNVGLLPPTNAQGSGAGFVSYTIKPLTTARSGAGGGG